MGPALLVARQSLSSTKTMAAIPPNALALIREFSSARTMNPQALNLA